MSVCSYPVASGELGPASGEQLLQQALQEEAAKAASKGLLANPFAGVQFKEVLPFLGTYLSARRHAPRTNVSHIVPHQMIPHGQVTSNKPCKDVQPLWDPVHIGALESGLI